MKQLFQRVALTLTLAVVIFFSCKKENSCEGCQPDPMIRNSNKPPIAAAGPDQAITLPKHRVLLDGSGSNDPDNNITIYQWSKISGPLSNIANAYAIQTQVSNLTEGTYLFELKVTDAGGLD